MIAQIIRTLQSNEFYGAGEYTEIAKGKNEIARDWKHAKKKIIRIIKAK